MTQIFRMVAPLHLFFIASINRYFHLVAALLKNLDSRKIVGRAGPDTGNTGGMTSSLRLKGMPAKVPNDSIRDPRKTARLDGAASSDGALLDWFLEDQDESAFETLVRRHGPMVLAVCRRILGDVPDVDDAFQATFVVLLRKGASIRPRGQVGAWLHGVARRVAFKAKGLTARQRQREQPMLDWPTETTHSIDQRDWLPLLDHELDRLPEKYRAVVVLCDLQGQSRREAAANLRLSEGTLSSRLARARALLGNRLKRRGVALSAALVVFSESTAAAAAPALLATTRATALAAASGSGLAPNVSLLSQGVIQAMFVSKMVKSAALVLIVAGLCAGAGTSYFLHLAHADKPAKPAAPASADKPKPAAVEGQLSGRVQAIADDKKTITLIVNVPGTKQSKEETITLGQNVSVVLSGGSKKETKPGKIEDIAVGDTVTAQLSDDKKSIVSLHLQAPTLRGDVKSVDAAKKTITFMMAEVAKGEKRVIEKTVEVPDDAPITLDDGVRVKGEPAKEGKLSNISEGVLVSVQLSTIDRSKAVHVTVSGPSVFGKVKTFEKGDGAGNGSITIIQKGDKELTFPVAKDVRISAGKGKPVELAAGASASLRLSIEDKKTVVGIAVSE
jgi:RNA polymerase sigma factor (sigma-70 family)